MGALLNNDQDHKKAIRVHSRQDFLFPLKFLVPEYITIHLEYGFRPKAFLTQQKKEDADVTLRTAQNRLTDSAVT